MDFIEKNINSIEDTNKLHELSLAVRRLKENSKKGECDIHNQCDKVQELIIARTDYIVTNKGLVSVS